jgi:hypothetical protein
MYPDRQKVNLLKSYSDSYFEIRSFTIESLKYHDSPRLIMNKI